MNPRTLQTIALGLGCILALQSATTAFAQDAATGVNPDPHPPVASAPVATSSPADQTADMATGGGSPETTPASQAPYPDAPLQTQDLRESLRVEQTKEAAKTQSPDRDAFQQPQGAAAAQLQPTTGTAASQPAGAAIAPAKQKRSRSFLIGLGVLAGVGVALGAVVGLSSASPSRPSGSR